MEESIKLNKLIDADTSHWATQLEGVQPSPRILFSALGATRAQAGSLENQRKIDYDLNMDVARAAKAAGAEVYVLISSAGISPISVIPYSRLKFEIEEAAKALDFKHLVLLKPGMIIGDRAESRPIEAVFRGLARGVGKLSGGLLKDFWAQDADVIARAAVNAGLECLDGQAPAGKVWMVSQAEIIKLGHVDAK